MTKKMMATINQINLDEQIWICLAKDVCPNCKKPDLIVENQSNFTAIITCSRCLAKYQMSPIRSRGAKKIN